MNNKQMLITIGGVAAAIGIFFLLADYSVPVDQKSDIPEPMMLSAAETMYDFGDVSMAKGKVTRNFKVANNSGQPVNIGRVYTSCMCTEAKLMMGGESFGPYGMPGHGMTSSINKTMVPGSEADVEAIFDPAAHGPAGIGPVERAIYIETKNGAPLELKFRANVTP